MLLVVRTSLATHLARLCLQEQVLAEASMMVPDTRQRLETALADLQQCLVITAFTHTTKCSAVSYASVLQCQSVMLCRVKATKLGIARSSNKQNWLLQMPKQYLSDFS